MEQHANVEQPQSLTIILEIVSEDERNPDPVAVSAVSLDVVEALQQDGYTVTPVSTKQKGGIELFFQVVTSWVQAVGTEAWAQRDIIAIVSNLCTIIVAASPVLMRLFHGKKQEQKQHPASASTQEQAEEAIHVSLLIDGAPIELTSEDIASDERILQLAERFVALHPTTKPTRRSKVAVQRRVPKRKPHRKR